MLLQNLGWSVAAEKEVEGTYGLMLMLQCPITFNGAIWTLFRCCKSSSRSSCIDEDVARPWDIGCPFYGYGSFRNGIAIWSIDGIVINVGFSNKMISSLL